MKAVNDGVRFVVELCALAAIAYWGWRTGGSTATKLLMAVGGVVLVAVVWGIFRSESDAVVEVPAAVRIIIEVTVFAAATAALAAVGRVGLAIAFAVVAGIDEILNYTLD
jgi:Protein of unknown function (DUF2568)